MRSKQGSYETAMSLKLHQDTLRWTIFAGNVALVGSIATLLSDVDTDPGLKKPLGTLAFVAGNLFFIVLSVENWYYNLYSLYTKACEEKIAENKPIPAYRPFWKAHGRKVTQFHYSYTLVLMTVVVSNTFMAAKYLAAGGCVLVIYVLVCCLALLFWRQLIVGFIFAPVNALFDWCAGLGTKANKNN
jgi:hypothetical protein